MVSFSLTIASPNGNSVICLNQSNTTQGEYFALISMSEIGQWNYALEILNRNGN